MTADDNQLQPTEDDTELVAQLKRLGSDISFRRWTRHRVKIVAILIAFDLMVSGGTIAALVRVHDVQQEACRRDNDLRSAYVAQWKPVLDDALRRDDPASRDTVARFSEAFKAFAPHEC